MTAPNSGPTLLRTPSYKPPRPTSPLETSAESDKTVKREIVKAAPRIRNEPNKPA